jgi:hypothetical protein
MKKWLILSVMLVVATISQASAATVTFDDAYANSILYDVYSNGSSFSDLGLTFTNNGSYMYVWDSSSPNSNGTNNLIFLGSGGSDYLTITKTGGGAFDLYKLDMSISWYDPNTTENILVNGSPITLIQGIQTYTLNLLGVTQVNITGVTGYWLADNIKTNVAAPLPGSLLLLGSCLVGLIGLRRRS